MLIISDLELCSISFDFLKLKGDGVFELYMSSPIFVLILISGLYMLIITNGILLISCYFYNQNSEDLCFFIKNQKITLKKKRYII